MNLDHEIDKHLANQKKGTLKWSDIFQEELAQFMIIGATVMLSFAFVEYANGKAKDFLMIELITFYLIIWLIVKTYWRYKNYKKSI